MKLPAKTRILLALLLCMVCTLEVNATELNLTCTVNITACEAAEGEYWTSYYNGEADMIVDPNTTTVYTARLTSNGEVVLTPVADNIVNKGQGVLLKADREQIDLCAAPYASITSYADNALRGTDTDAAQESGTDYYVLGTQGDAPVWVKLPADATLAAHKAFLPLPAGTELASAALSLAGDANNDGFVNASDVITLVRHLIGLNPQPFNATAADANGDEAITIADVTILINTLLTSSQQQGSNLDPYDDSEGDAGQAV